MTEVLLLSRLHALRSDVTTGNRNIPTKKLMHVVDLRAADLIRKRMVGAMQVPAVSSVQAVLFCTRTPIVQQLVSLT